MSERVKLVLGSAKPETAMSGVAAYPASGSFVSLEGYDVVDIVAHLGTLHASDTPTLEPKCSDANNGTLDRIDAALVHTCDVTNDDGKTVCWSIQVNKLPADHKYIALATGGTLTNGSYIDVLFLLQRGKQPVTQPTTHSASYNYLG